MVLLVAVVVAGRYIYKSFTTPVVNDVQLTDEVEEIEGEEISEEIEENTEETQMPSAEEMENFDANEIPILEWSEEIAAGTISDEVKNFVSKINMLIKKRKTQPADESKLTEEDIDLMEKVIEELKKFQ